MQVRVAGVVFECERLNPAMKKYKQFYALVLIGSVSFLFAFRYASGALLQDAKKDALIYSAGKGNCSGGMLQMNVKNSGTQKINVTILKKETNSEFSTTSTIKLSGIPPGYKQAIGCGGKSGQGDSLVVTYIVAAASYAN
jgi:hypothetical protein